MGQFKQYVRHLYYKYESQLDPFDSDCLWHGCGVDCLDGIATDEEQEKLARLWEQDYELGLVD